MLVLTTKKDDFDRLAFSPDSQGLVAAGKSGVLWWPAIADPNRSRPFGMGKATTVGVSPDGDWIVASGKRLGVCVYSTTDGSERVLLRVGAAYWASVSPRDSRVVTCHINGRTLSAWEFKTGLEPVKSWKVESELTVAEGRFAANGSVFAHLGVSEPVRGNTYRRLVCRSPDSGEVIRSITFESTPWGPFEVAPGGQWFATFLMGELSVCAVVCDAPEVLRIVGDKKKYITAAAFHPSGRYLAATSNDTTVKLYDTTTWQLAHTFNWNIGRLRSIAFSPDGLLAAAGSDSGKIVVWDVDV